MMLILVNTYLTIKDIGHENVVQIVTDNASNNMDATNLLALEWPNIFWTSCAIHTINLMPEGISKLPSFKGVIDKAKSFTILINANNLFPNIAKFS
ncbi:hypothetical protein FEM48_Zijuj05G0137100 [Ziziphus jujuba var. spinosa]|uniref:DUF659 domain-containing protein n=1 Tax=Ziziphus jujuba var. spinosa TaxID=714518 RepID=A0A978VF61_ZIZJJ|nr:hypothetical protein FEM48_Zijuj05G0137100 [Ziziphus jujuba var. spinosa]